MNVTQQQVPTLEEVCGSYDLHEGSSGMDQDTKSSPWKAEPFSQGAGVEQVIEATLSIPSA